MKYPQQHGSKAKPLLKMSQAHTGLVTECGGRGKFVNCKSKKGSERPKAKILMCSEINYVVNLRGFWSLSPALHPAPSLHPCFPMSFERCILPAAWPTARNTPALVQRAVCYVMECLHHRTSCLRRNGVSYVKAKTSYSPSTASQPALSYDCTVLGCVVFRIAVSCWLKFHKNCLMNFCLGLGQNFQQFLTYAVFYYTFMWRSIFNIDDYKIKI